MKVAAGSIFLELLLILSFLPLKNEVDLMAASETAGNFEALLSSLFPYLWLFLIIIFAGVIVWGVALKK